MTPTLQIAPLAAADRLPWEALARGYKAFYKTEASPEQYEASWQRLLQRDEVYGLGAKLDGRLVGIAHYLFHTGVWAPRYCYLQDLFVEPGVRGRGVARALIGAVAAAARETGAQRYYWLTQENNTTARTLYDKVAQFEGFIRYDHPL